MKIRTNRLAGWGLMGLILFAACEKDAPVKEISTIQPADTSYKPTPYLLKIPVGWSIPPIPANNPMTVEGVTLGRKLFYDPILSANNTQSCGSCHNQTFGFTDNGLRYSKGIDQIEGTRQSMPLFNLAWVERFAPVIGNRPYRFFWDGGATDLESQVIGPITNPIEMHDSLPHVLAKLQAHPVYPELFRKAFGSSVITTPMLMKAIAQFERTIISSESKFDKFLINVTPGGVKFFDFSVFSPEEKNGYDIFMDEARGDCFHCHTASSPFTSDFGFHNNGHQSTDEGLKRITGLAEDVGKFRTPSLRNLVFTAPYMHDGRLNTLEEVVEFYNSQAIRVFPADPFISKHQTGLNLSVQDKADLVAFLKTMTDSTFLQKQEFGKP